MSQPVSGRYGKVSTDLDDPSAAIAEIINWELDPRVIGDGSPEPQGVIDVRGKGSFPPQFVKPNRYARRATKAKQR